LDLQRLHLVLAPKNPDAAYRALRALRRGLKILEKYPETGRPVPEYSGEYREWIIEFGQASYVALYHYKGKQVTILAIRHSREAGY